MPKKAARKTPEIDMRHRSPSPSGRHRLVLRWSAVDNPLPVQVMDAPPSCPAAAGQPWHTTGPVGEPFDFTSHLRRLMHDVVERTPEFAHIEPSKILVSATQARGGRPHGLQARVTPLRFQNGQLVRQRQGVTYRVQRYFLDDHEFLYVMAFCLPRFLDQPFDDKVVTLFHELQHIDPSFNGDLRRHAGRCQFHSASKLRYDRHMTELARAYLTAKPDPQLHAFLRLSFAQLQQRHGSITAIIVPRPKLIPIPTVQTAAAHQDA